MSDPARPWCCPEPRCQPLHQLKDYSASPLDEPQPGQSFVWYGRMVEDVKPNDDFWLVAGIALLLFTMAASIALPLLLDAARTCR